MFLFLQCDFDTFDLRDLNCKFDVILVEPPLEEYQRSVGLSRERYWSWEEVRGRGGGRGTSIRDVWG